MDFKQGNHSFYLGESDNAPLAIITYHSYDTSTIVIDHTYVSEAMRGQGIALELVKEVAKYARKEHLKIIPACSYADKVMNRTAEFHDVLKRQV
jgi:predicted GNAT family acetyltransferase